MEVPTPDLAEVIRTTDEALRQHAATPSALDSVLRRQGERLTQTVRMADIPLLSPAMDKMKPEHLPKMLPKGISGGKVAAIVAGVAVAGGALYALTRKKEKSPETWAGRIQAERESAADLGQSR